MKKLFFALLLLALLVPFAASAQEEDYRHLFDQTGTFSREEQQALEQEMDALWRDLRLDVMIVTTNDSQRKEPELFAADFYESQRPNYHDIEDCVIFAFCFDIGARGAYGEATHGRAHTILTSQGDDALYDVLAPYLPSRAYGSAMKSYLQYVRTLMTPKTPMQIAAGFFPFALLGGLVIGLVAVFSMKSQMKLAKNKSDAGAYTLPNSLSLTHQQDIFLYETESRQRIESSSGGGGSSRGGGRSFSSSSGRSYGGRSGRL